MSNDNVMVIDCLAGATVAIVADSAVVTQRFRVQSPLAARAFLEQESLMT